MQVLVPRRVALDNERTVLVRRCDGVLVEVEHQVRDVRCPELVGDAPADTAVAADDEVVAQLVDRPLPPPFCKRTRDDTAGNRLDDNRTRVADDRQAGGNEDDRCGSRAVVGGNRVQPGQGHGDDGAIERLEPRLVQGLPEGDRPAEQRGRDGCEQPYRLTQANVRGHPPSMWPWKRTSSAHPKRSRRSGGSTSRCRRSW